MKFTMLGIPPLVIRSREIIRQDGIFHFSSRVVRAISLVASNYFFSYRKWYIYEHDLSSMISRREDDLLPDVPDFKCLIIGSVDQARELQNQGYNILAKINKAADKLTHGAIAFCLFSGLELMHVGWICRTKEARDSINPVPYKIDFSSTASVEGAETLPPYIGRSHVRSRCSFKGLLAYSYYKRAQYLLASGISMARYAILVNNISSQRIAERYGAKKLSSIRLYKIIGLEMWKELPLY